MAVREQEADEIADGAAAPNLCGLIEAGIVGRIAHVL